MSNSGNMVTLRSKDDVEFVVEKAVAMESLAIRFMLEDICTEGSIIPVPNVDAATLSKVIEYCKRHLQNPDSGSNEEELRKFDAEFVKVEQSMLFDLIMAANYLNISGLLDLTCQTLADMIKGKAPEEIRKLFNIKNDFTPEEEEEIRRENQWAFD